MPLQLDRYVHLRLIWVLRMGGLHPGGDLPSGQSFGNQDRYKPRRELPVSACASASGASLNHLPVLEPQVEWITVLYCYSFETRIISFWRQNI